MPLPAGMFGAGCFLTLISRQVPGDSPLRAGFAQTPQWLGGTLGLSVLVTAYGTAARHASGTPAGILTEGSARAFGVGALIALAALLVPAFVITGRKREPSGTEAG
ncbi:hypothetical protein ACIBL8_22985 [Streptomyces sp. NPDC050523]|uniref:hypothetical protein n=1 Tax=Streptomyces sp. NPDC050523 TaxID=3365622 RepID=UPI00378947ED